MATTCISSVDTNPIQPLLASPVCGGNFRASADCFPGQRDHQQTRFRELGPPFRSGGPTTCTPGILVGASGRVHHHRPMLELSFGPVPPSRHSIRGPMLVVEGG